MSDILSGILAVITNFQILLVIAGLLALFMAIIAPISIHGCELLLSKTWQRVSLVILGVLAIFGAIFTSLNGQKGELPIGTVIAWAPIGELALPREWVVCGQHEKTPTLAGRFLMGVASISDADKKDGRSTIAEREVDVVTAANSPIRQHDIPCEGKCVFDREHNHKLKVKLPSEGNLPPYYTVIFLCKVK